jgi:prepilin-type N-terminal cleavage/methylation domain-containing protein
MRQPGFFLPRQRGFTLIEIAIVIAILGFLLVLLIGISSGLIGQQRRETTRQRLTAIEVSMALFVSQNSRLPCPALGTLPVGTENALAGVCQNSQKDGVVPWAALGISEVDATDGWGNRFTYRVAPELTLANGMNFSYCDPAGGDNITYALPPYCVTCTSLAGCTTPKAALKNKGLVVQNINGDFIMNPNPAGSLGATGAAYVVISHGENAAGAYNSSGAVQAAAGAQAGTREQQNYANAAYSAGYVFVDDFPNYQDTSLHFDDFVLRPTVLSVATKAQLGPRVRFGS